MFDNSVMCEVEVYNRQTLTVLKKTFLSMRCGRLVYQMLTQILNLLGKGNMKLRKRIRDQANNFFAVPLGKKFKKRIKRRFL